MPNVLIYDYGGNTGSLERALKRLGASPEIGDRSAGHTHVILPGQGSAMNANCWSMGGYVLNHRPLLGICLGLQVLCQSTAEAAGPCAGLFAGRCEKLPVSPLPHIGWNTIEGYGEFYFCHSYAVLDSPDAIAHTEYHGCRFVSLMQKGNIWGIQAHPEKSGDAGMEYLKGFLKL